ncbi:hypothetical protein DL766_006506 [Monosporascus sp. MC13-8B]|uniref:UspA domain-containing protein n=1 Tax=Monosporascus cannonballus TaxID=155416 RepID=A0ABY0H5J2_9PEZI|nr:hypothetical protein DL762_005195 [Monosporascus cannonballus]RYP27131.1 hypothetical protein DL766_006506 [Monosporascus sp. MC13-8B]
MSSRRVMSLEAALEEERAEIENLILQRQNAARSPPPRIGGRSSSPYSVPQSPVRSMLDIGPSPRSPTQAPVRSMLDVDSAPPPPRRSMLDVSDNSLASGSRSAGPSSTHTSPTLPYKPLAPANSSRNRSVSDAESTPADFGPRSPPPASPRNGDVMSAYQFGNILPTNVGQAAPGRRAQGHAPRSSSIGEALRGPDLSNLVLPGERGRIFPRRSNKSKSPSNRFSLRSNSPHGSLLGNSGSQQPQGTLMLENGQIVDMNNAYRRLSDANLLYGGSSLASLARKKTADADGLGRIEKDNMSPYGELLSDEDSDEDAANSSDEEAQRGRKLTTRAEEQKEGPGQSANSAKSLLAAAEEERKQVSAQPQYRSLFDEPEITVTSPTGDKSKQVRPSKQTVQPNTNFDQEPPLSGTQTPLYPDMDADVSAIRMAQNLQLTSTAIISNPEVHRSVRIIYRGEYTRIQKEAEEEHRRLRKYLVALDLSDESAHALEWATGTVLRDGDTLIAIYCMDEETSGSVDASNLVPDEPRAMREQAAALNAMARVNGRQGSHTASPYMRALDARSTTPSPAPSSRGKNRLEEERERAVQEITEKVSRLLRKTQLQVRVIVEVIHCKNPKHLITEVIDYVNPTLVILGSRGRSALKGTLLGSFSNYLVTKSSVPVMVARKRLKKKSKYQPPPTKQVNNLANPQARSLETARID